MTALRDRAAFRSAYDEAMRRWPPGTAVADLPSEFGLTRVYSCGPAQGRPVVLLSAYGATSLEWNALAHDLAADHRVHAIDVPGDPGGSVADGIPIDVPERMRAWLVGVLDGLGASSAHLVGHSYGAWIALDLALHGSGGAPARVSGLTLLDPTMCFAPLVKSYIFRATPVMMRPSGERRTGLIKWETRGVPLNQDWLALTALGTDAFGLTTTVSTRIPPASAFTALTAPTTALFAGRGRVNPTRSAARRAAARSPLITARILPDASHYGLPMTHPQQVAAAVRPA
ncbi:alpha/beta fold hydrolase [Nakamurella sp.]|uniref:alpha/beta fold hydrolase n=1 Tax=Nakamurella sp. TaxID=1869182 RepID=UPI003B3A823F